MAYDQESDLKYIDSLGDIPLTGPDPYSDSEKLSKAEDAEVQLEADVNDGREIPEDDREHIHAVAANAYASYLLATGPEHPKDATSEVFAGGSGEDLMEFATELKNIYDRTIGSIEAATDDDPSPDRQVYTTHKG